MVIKMKKVISAILAAMAIGVCGTSAFAAAPADTKVLSVIVSGKTADLSALPQGAYKNGDTVMVPLRTVCMRRIRLQS